MAPRVAICLRMSVNRCGGGDKWQSRLDSVDRQIVDALVADGRMSIRGLAERLHISRANAYARVERLRSSGVILGFRVR